jgi:hypothetical protein
MPIRLWFTVVKTNLVANAFQVARTQNLGPDDFVKAECTACGHEELLPPSKLRIKGLALPPYTPVIDLERQLRCREWEARGEG